MEVIHYTTEYELSNGIETLKFNSEKEACEFLGVRKSTVLNFSGVDANAKDIQLKGLG